MSNPAWDLATILEGWATHTTAPIKVRRDVAARNESDLVRDQSAAMRAYLKVEDWIVSLRDMGTEVSHFEDYLTKWQDAIILPRTGMHNSPNGSRVGIQSDELGVLRSLANVIDAYSRMPRLTPDRGKALLEIIRKGKIFVEAHKDDISDFSRLQLSQSLGLAEKAVTEGDVLTALRALATYSGTLQLLAEEAILSGRESEGSAFYDAAKSTARDLAVNFATSVAMKALGM